MTYIHSATRFIRVYILSQEAIITYFTLVVLYLLIFQRKSVQDFVSGIWPFSMSNSDTETYQLSKYQKVKGISTVGHDEKTKASWELRKSNVGVYAIQGRRQHMEDRFNVVTDLEHTGTSIYGIFDGHGGELAADFVEKTLFKTVMVRLLKSALVDHNEDLGKLLTEEILYVDKQLLAVEKLTNDVSVITLCKQNYGRGTVTSPEIDNLIESILLNSRNISHLVIKRLRTTRCIVSAAIAQHGFPELIYVKFHNCRNIIPETIFRILNLDNDLKTLKYENSMNAGYVFIDPETDNSIDPAIFLNEYIRKENLDVKSVIAIHS